MIDRNYLRCSSCREVILARIDTAPSRLTKFAFPCPICEYIIRGHYHGESLESHTIQFQGAERVYPGKSTSHVGAAFGLHAPEIENQPPTVTLGLTIPLDPRTRDLGEPFSGPNITFGSLFGDRSKWAMDAYHRLQKMGPLWESYQQLIHHYLRGDWGRFSTVGAELYGENWREPRNAQERQIIALQPAFLFLLPILPQEHGSRMMDDHVRAVLNVQDCSKLAAWVHEVEDNGVLPTLQRSLLDTLRLYVDQWESWAPGLIYAMDPEPDSGLDRLVLSRDDFSALRDLYVQAYETCCQALPYAIALMNSELRGDPNSFPPVPSTILADNARAARPASITAFTKLPNSSKMRWFGEWANWEQALPTILDKDVRNAIGHAAARHDVRTGQVQSDRFAIPYGELASKVLLLGHMILMALQVVKTLRLLAADWASSSVHDDARNSAHPPEAMVKDR